jgi:hypothetical protein
VFIYGLCDAVNISKYLIFTDDIKIRRAINYPKDYNLMLYDIDSVRG